MVSDASTASTNATVNWQAILTPLLPAVVTAVALLAQAALTAKRTSRTQRETDRRAEILAAHRDALAAIGQMEQPLLRRANLTAVEIEAGTYEQPELMPVSHADLAAFAAAQATVRLLCGWDSQKALTDYHGALMRLGSTGTAEEPTGSAISQAMVDASFAQAKYVTAARAELDIRESRASVLQRRMRHWVWRVRWRISQRPGRAGAVARPQPPDSAAPH